MKNRWVLAFFVSAVLIAICEVADEGDDTWPRGDLVQSLPRPPCQEVEWIIPTVEIPPEFISTTKKLFEQGLADPRGGEYCTIIVGADGTFFGNGRVARCRGWLLPGLDDRSKRFAVCWDGLMHAVLAVGGKADLEADVRSLLKIDSGFGKAGWFPGTDQQSILGGMALSRNVLLPEKICLLLRLGKADLATELWKQYAEINPVKDPKQIYLVVAHGLMTNALARAEGAHKRGEDRLAWLYDVALRDLQEKVTSQLASRGVQLKEDEFSDLSVLLDLLADDQRRANTPPRLSAIQRGRSVFAGKKEWIAALIGSLDQVTGVSLWRESYSLTDEDPVVKALSECGEDAIEPLIDCCADDNRATRQIYDGKLLMVCDVALEIILNNLQTHQFDQSRAGRNQLAHQLREYWTKNKQLSRPERCFLTISDDEADPQQWAEAMTDIVSPADEKENADRQIWTKKSGGSPMRGETLRSKNNPSVTDIVAKRIVSLNQFHSPDPQSDPRVTANNLAMQLAQWDPARAAPVLRDQLLYSAGIKQPYLAFESKFQRSIASLAITMARTGDDSGLLSYSKWFQKQTIGPYTFDFGDQTLLMPLYLYPDDPGMKAATRRIFEDPDSPWNPLMSQHENCLSGDSIIASPLLGSEICRSFVLRKLLDTTQTATVTVKEDRIIESSRYRLPSRPNQIRIDSMQTPLPPVGTVIKVRECDECAAALSAIPGMPLCEPYWSLADRDAAIHSSTQILKRYGKRLKDAEQSGLEDFAVSNSPTRFVFSRLDHPAGTTDLASGDAIFSLEGIGQRRAVSSMQFPRSARWTTLKKYPVDSTMTTVEGHQKAEVHYRQDCLVWQAEEVLINGKWQRFYGVQGPHELARVPADEISFCSWTQSPPAIEPLIGMLQGSDYLRYYPAASAEPLHADLVFYNQSGLPVSIASSLVAKLDGSRLALRPGVTLTVEKEKSVDDDDFEPVLISVAAKAPFDTLVPQLQTGLQVIEADQEFTSFKLNLRDYFNLTDVGSYRLTVRVAANCGVSTGATEYDALFRLR